MVKNGFTLVELIVVIFLIALFSVILTANFPAMLQQFALTRAAYRFSEDVRMAQDMGLSGTVTTNVKGYGIFIDINKVDPVNLGSAKYIIYGAEDSNKQYVYSSQINSVCGQQFPQDIGKDCIVKTVDLSKIENGIIIISPNSASINFTPPNPDTTITSLSSNDNNINVVFAVASNPSQTKTVSINTSGLIEVK